MNKYDESKQALLVKIDKALKHVFDIAAGRERWTMRIPARPDEDSDCVLADVLHDARQFILSQPDPSGELEALPWLVQYRGLNGNSPGDWTTMAAFDQEGPAENYARECGGETRPWEYRALRASGGKD